MSTDPSSSPSSQPNNPPTEAASTAATGETAPKRGPLQVGRRTEGSRSPGSQSGSGQRPPRRERLAGEAAPQTASEREDQEERQLEAAAKAREVRTGPAPPVPVPSRRGPLSADLEAEINEALGGLSLEDVLGDRPVSAGRLDNESRHRAQVVEVHGDNVFFSLGGKNQGVCSVRAFENPPSVGDMIDVIVTGYSAEDGLHDLAIPGGTLVASDWGDIVEGNLVEARITAANTGGLECSVNGIRAFIPASQTGLFRTENLGDFVGQKLVCVVSEANERRGNLVLSRRAVLEREKEESKKQLMATLQVGDLREGTVRKIHDFGAFVDLGGVDGLVHISQLSWERVKHPSEVLSEGQKVRVRIEKIDSETGKLSLSLRNLEEHPWTGIEQRFPVGTTVRGPITRLAKFGAFVKLAPGVEGLVHISELAHHRVYAVQNIVKEGQEVEAKVLSVDADEQRIGLSLKAAMPMPVKEDKKTEEVTDEPPRAATVPKRKGPLQGGTNKPTGGEQFGLKW